MSKTSRILFTFMVFAFTFSVFAQTTVTTEKINGEGLKKLLPNKENNKPLLINFWATWCGPCRVEFPDLVKIDAYYRAIPTPKDI